MADAGKFIITPAEALQELDITDVKSDATLLGLIEASSDEIEGFLRRELVTRGTITEYHEVTRSTADLFLKQRPIIAVASVHETGARTYDSTTVILEDTDFLVYTADGRLVRMSSSARKAWFGGGFESIRVVYTGGYATIHDVPRDIKKVCGELVAMQYREITERAQNQESVSDDFGTVRRFGPPMLTSKMTARLWKHRNVDFGSHTWKR